VIAQRDERPAPALASVGPVLRPGPSWFEYQGADSPHLLRMHLPVSAEEMAAALYRDRESWRDDAYFEVGRHVWEHVALVIVEDGLAAVQQIAAGIRDQEADPDWLAYCRQRVTEVTGLPDGCRTAIMDGAGCGACDIDDHDREYWRDLRTRNFWQALWAWETRSPAARRHLTLLLARTAACLALASTIAVIALT
jgi:hypothetical protein